MDRLGIERALVSPAEGYLPVRNREGNELVAAATASSAGRLLGYAVATPWLGDRRGRGAEACARCGRRRAEARLRACRASTCSTARPSRSSRSRSNRGWPVYVRTGTPPHALPLQVAWLAARFPEGSFLLGKAGATDFSHDGPATLAAAPNVYADSVYVEWPTALAAADPDGIGGRVFFSTDAPFGDAPIELARVTEAPYGAGGARRDPRRHARGPARAVIGLRSGDAVVVHASLRAVGLDANEVIDALLEAVGPDGLVVMPTFTYDNETLRAGHRRAYGDARGGVPSPPGRAALGPPDVLGRSRRRRAPPSSSTGTSGRERPASTARSNGSPLPAATSSCSASATRRTRPSTWASSTPTRRTWTSRSTPTGRRTEPTASPGAAARSGRSSGRCASGQRSATERSAVRSPSSSRAATVIDATVELLRDDPAALLCTDPGCYRCSRARARLG